MDIIEIRRENLRRWVDKHGTPTKERSLFSQLKADGSFGERVARRLEEQYRMGAGYLDQDPTAQETSATAVQQSLSSVDLGDELLKRATEMLETYRLAGPADRERIDLAVQRARDNISAADKSQPRGR